MGTRRWVAATLAVVTLAACGDGEGPAAVPASASPRPPADAAEPLLTATTSRPAETTLANRIAELSPRFIILREDGQLEVLTISGESTGTVDPGPTRDGFDRLLLEADGGLIVQDGSRLTMIDPDRVTPTEIRDYADVAAIDDDGYWAVPPSSAPPGPPASLEWRRYTLGGEPTGSLWNRSPHTALPVAGDGHWLADWDRASGDLRIATGDAETVTHDALHVAGSEVSLAYVYNGSIFWYEATSGNTVELASSVTYIPASTFEGAQFSPDGARLALLAKDPATYEIEQLIVWELEDRSSTSVEITDGAVVQWLADDVLLIHGDGQASLVAPVSGETLPLDLDTGRATLVGVVGG